MKKFFLFAATTAVLVALSGCGSSRTPTTGKYSKYTYYNTFFGISLESAVYGDGLIVNGK